MYDSQNPEQSELDFGLPEEPEKYAEKYEMYIEKEELPEELYTTECD